MRKRLIWGMTIAAMLAVGLLAAGCGGGDDALSKSEFLKQGNAICKKGNKEIDKGANQTFGNKEPTQAQLNTFAEQTLIPSVETQIEQLRDLNPPSADEDQVNAILDEAQSALDKGKQDPTILTSEKSDPFKKANQLAKDYGLTECGG